MAADFDVLISLEGSPARNGAAVTPHDSTNFTNYARALWVGTGGTIVIITINGDTVTLTNVASGTLLPIAAKRVNSTSTTASGIVALW